MFERRNKAHRDLSKLLAHSFIAAVSNRYFKSILELISIKCIFDDSLADCNFNLDSFFSSRLHFISSQWPVFCLLRSIIYSSHFTNQLFIGHIFFPMILNSNTMKSECVTSNKCVLLVSICCCCFCSVHIRWQLLVCWKQLWNLSIKFGPWNYVWTDIFYME